MHMLMIINAVIHGTAVSGQFSTQCVCDNGEGLQMSGSDDKTNGNSKALSTPTSHFNTQAV